MSEITSDKFDKFKEVYLMEQHRIDSFEKWPYDETSSCSITKMAEAGFYWTGNRNKEEDDAATCFVCSKQLHGWDRSTLCSKTCVVYIRFLFVKNFIFDGIFII